MRCFLLRLLLEGGFKNLKNALKNGINDVKLIRLIYKLHSRYYALRYMNRKGSLI